MNKLFALLTVSIILSGCTQLPFLSSKQAALQVFSSPSAGVYLDDNYVGDTPYYNEDLKPAEYTLRLQVADRPDQEWTSQVRLNPGLVTVVNRTFGDTPDRSSHYTIQMEQLAGEDVTEISIITIPDNVIVKLDGQPEGFSPISLQDVTPGNHNLTLVAPGYAEQSVDLNVEAGYKLIVSAGLAKTQALIAPENATATNSAELTGPAATSSADTDEQNTQEQDESATSTNTPTATGSAQPTGAYVEITETGTGWLRVRSEPNASLDNEVARLDVGEQVPFIEANDTGWYQVEYSPGEQGWISGRYAELYD